MHEVYGELVGSGDLCFDIGAHRGAKTDMLLAQGARVIAVEPQPRLASALRNKYTDNRAVTVVECAVGCKDGPGQLAICQQADTIATMSTRFRRESRFSLRNFSWNTALSVRVTTLDALIAAHGVPVFCKIDVEGFERDVLAGLHQPVKCVSFEFHEEFLDEAARCLAELERLMPIQCNVVIGESSRFALDAWDEPEAILSRLPQLGTCDWGQWGDIYVRNVQFSGADG